MTGRPRRWATVIALLAIAVTAIVVTVVVRAERHEATLPDVVGQGAPRAGAATSVVRRFVAALEERDVLAAADLSVDAGAAAQVRAAIENAGRLGLVDLSGRYVDAVGAPSADGSWSAAVELSWRVRGEGDRPASAEVLVRFAGVDDVRLAGFGPPDAAPEPGAAGAGLRTPLWLQDPLTVVRRGPVVVMSAVDRAAAVRTADRAARAVRVVTRTLEDWEPGVVVEVPRDAAGLEQALGVEPGTYEGVAAVTATVDGSTEREAVGHVFVNPDLTRRLRAAGAQVVMSHEVTHVATGAATTAMDLWLLEGFADFVALRDTTLPDRTTLGRAIELARAEGVPARLPGEEQFDTRAAGLQAAYEQAWLACRLVAERLGVDALVRIYRQAARGVPVARALARAGLPQGELVRLWRGRLHALTR